MRSPVFSQIAQSAHSKIEMWYLHGPDRHSGTSYEDTMRGVNDLYKEG